MVLMQAAATPPDLEKERLRKFNRNCSLTRLIAWSMLAFTAAALAISLLLDSGVFFEFPMVLSGGAFMLMLYRLFELSWFLHERGATVKLPGFTAQTLAPIPKSIRRMGEAGVLIAFGITLLVSPLLASKFMGAAGTASPIVNYFGIILTTYMYCALIALLAISGMMRLGGLGAGGEKFVQNALWKNVFFYIAYVGLIAVHVILAML